MSNHQYTHMLAAGYRILLACLLCSPCWGVEPLGTPHERELAGQMVLLDRQRGHCLLCHQVDQLANHPQGEFQGDIAPDLSNVGNRLTAAELRARIADPLQANPNSLMPGYHLDEAQQGRLFNVAPAFRNQPILTAQELDDLVLYLSTLQLAK